MGAGDQNSWKQEDVWDPNKFLRPEMNHDGTVKWFTPDGNII